MHHRADDKDVPWLNELFNDEIAGTNKEASARDEFVAPTLGDHNPFGSSILDKIAADEATAVPTTPAAPPASNEATPTNDDDLAAIESQIDSATSIDELNALEEKLKKMNDDGDLGGDAPESNDPMSAEMGTDPVSGAPLGGAPVPGTDELKKSIDDINKKLDDKAMATQETLLKEVKKLNEEMGNNKPVDLNNTIDQSS